MEEHWLWGDGDGVHIHLLYRDQHQLHHVTNLGKETPSTVSNKLIQCGFVRVESGHLSSKTLYIGICNAVRGEIKGAAVCLYHVRMKYACICTLSQRKCICVNEAIDTQLGSIRPLCRLNSTLPKTSTLID